MYLKLGYDPNVLIFDNIDTLVHGYQGENLSAFFSRQLSLFGRSSNYVSTNPFVNQNKKTKKKEEKKVRKSNSHKFLYAPLANCKFSDFL